MYFHAHPQHVDVVFASAEGASENSLGSFGTNFPKMCNFVIGECLRLPFENASECPDREHVLFARGLRQHVNVISASTEGASAKIMGNVGVNFPKFKQFLSLASDVRLTFENA